MVQISTFSYVAQVGNLCNEMKYNEWFDVAFTVTPTTPHLSWPSVPLPAVYPSPMFLSFLFILSPLCMCVCVWEGDENPTGQIWDKQYVCVGHISNAKSSIQLSNFLHCDWSSSTLHSYISSTIDLSEPHLCHSALSIVQVHQIVF